MFCITMTELRVSENIKLVLEYAEQLVGKSYGKLHDKMHLVDVNEDKKAPDPGQQVV